MAVRAACRPLVRRLRRMIGDRTPADPAVATTWTDDELQDALDQHREDVALRPLEAVASYPAGVLSYLTFAADYGDWDEAAACQDAAYTALTATEADFLTGRWTFAAQPDLPVYLTGRTYDLHAAAADLLEQWAAEEADAIDFSEGRTGGSYKQSQAPAARRAAAAEHRSQQRVRTVDLIRTDVNPRREGGVPRRACR